MTETLERSSLLHTGLTWSNSFHALGADFSTSLAPQALPEPYWVGRCDAVAELLGLPQSLWQGDGLLAALSGQQPISGTRPLASVYSGHQFGSWAGQLGDGRALLLGEINGQEIQLKGSGRTPYSRMGDGKAVLRSSIREFLCSEAMAALGIPTTRCLCVIGSDEPVPRETWETAAVVTRVAPSFIRFGHFEHFAARNQLSQLKTLADYVIQRYYPECLTASSLNANPYANLLQSVAHRTALMVAHWQAVGFCHGVMNTDNMSILGLTLDYGPFQFMDSYAPRHICNHSDIAGRYAFREQPEVAHWNLMCLAQALLPLIQQEDLALQAVKQFRLSFAAHDYSLQSAKLGWSVDANDAVTLRAARTQLKNELLALLAANRVDYSIFWRRLAQGVAASDFGAVRDLFLARADFDTWLLHYQELSSSSGQAPQAALMFNHNPNYVLRNYLGQVAIEAAVAKDFSGVQNLLTVLQSPYDEHPEHAHMTNFPPDWAQHIEISCSS